MHKLFFSVIFYLLSSFCLSAQDAVLSFIDEDKKEFFRNNGWELYYSNDDMKFYDYIIYKEELVLAEIWDNDYAIHFLNENRLIEKSKNIAGNDHLPHTPKLYLDQDNIVFTPMVKFECIIIPEKDRVKKTNRLKFFKKRSKDEYFKRYLHYGDYTFYSFASLDKVSGFQKVEIQYGLDEKNLSTLYAVKMKSHVITYSYNSENLEIDFLEDMIFLVDNFDKKFLVFDFQGNVISTVELDSFKNELNSKFVGDVLLRKDPMNNKMYLVFNKNIYQILGDGKNMRIQKVEVNTDFSINKPRIYDNYLYSLFFIEEGNGTAIYRKKFK